MLLGPRAPSSLVKGSAKLLSFHATLVVVFKSQNDGSVDDRLQRTQRPARNPGARQAFPEGLGRRNQTEKWVG